MGTVFNIQRFTINDGPGIRTELFLKGCPLRCKWCSNPEGQIPQIQPGVYSAKCFSEKACGLCIKACQNSALLFGNDKLIAIDRSRCVRCMGCADACPADAIKQWGTEMSVAECMREILKDKGYYERSGGGVTVSGGEPLMQSDFVRDLFIACKEEGIHTCFESTLCLPFDTAGNVLPYTDLVITDIKHMNSEIHRANTGAGNEQILGNIKRICGLHKELIIRIPVIPGVNDDDDNIKATADFINDELKGRIQVLQLLSFMRMGEEKYASLGIPYPMEEIEIDRDSFQKHVAQIAEYFNDRGINCTVGTKE